VEKNPLSVVWKKTILGVKPQTSETSLSMRFFVYYESRKRELKIRVVSSFLVVVYSRSRIKNHKTEE